MKTNEVKFSELQNYNDSNSCVMVGIVFPDGFDGLNEFLSDGLGFSKGKNLIGMHRILGNVRGEDGRTDWLLEFDHEEIGFNPIARLMAGGDIKWTSDFRENYKEDYNI